MKTMTRSEESKYSALILKHMIEMVKELNSINSKYIFTGFEELGSRVLFDASMALQCGYLVDISVELYTEEDDKHTDNPLKLEGDSID